MYSSQIFKYDYLSFQLFPLCVSLMQQPTLSAPVLASSLLCVAELVSTLKSHAIVHLNEFVPALLHILNKQDQLKQNELLLTCSLTGKPQVLNARSLRETRSL